MWEACDLQQSTIELGWTRAPPAITGPSALADQASTALRAQPDASTSDVHCDPAATFAEYTPISEVTDDMDRRVWATSSADGLTLFVRYSEDDAMYALQRATTTTNFGSPEPYPALDPVFAEHPRLQLTTLSADTLNAYFVDTSGGSHLIRWASRTSTSSLFGDPTEQQGLTSEGLLVAAPWLSSDGQRLYGVILEKSQLIMARRHASDFGAPRIINADVAPYGGVQALALTASERVIYLTVTKRDGEFVEPSIVVRGERASDEAPFGNWQEVPVALEFSWTRALWLSDDECNLVFLGADESGAPGQLFLGHR
jgi:hypothetical protein